jgi:two-component system LytT family response regulator
MKIVAADDELMMLDDLVSAIRKAKPDAQIDYFQFPSKLLEFVKKTDTLDAAFLDVEMGTMSGIEVAKEIKKVFPKVNIIFVTGYEKYMREAFELHSSGYVTKPISEDAIEKELNNLRNPINDEPVNGLMAHCFGTFEVTMDGETLKFERSKTKEMLAYLIDRHGASVTSGELCAVLWEDKDVDKGTNHYLQVLKKDLIDTLKAIHQEDFFQYSRNEYRIDPMMVKCDYYDYLDNKPEGVWSYNGEYMSQYSWGENRNSWIMYRKA